jgi:hypothetical protein
MVASSAQSDDCGRSGRALCCRILNNSEPITTVRCLRLAAAVAASLTAASVTMSAPAFAQVKWILPSAYSVDNFHSQNLAAFAKDLAEATGGKIMIRLYPNGSLFPASAIKSAVRIGPFLATSYDEARKLWGGIETAHRAQVRSAGPDGAVCSAVAAAGNLRQQRDQSDY